VVANWKLLQFFSLGLILILVLGACSEASPNFGKAFRGRSLNVTIYELQRTDDLRYASTGSHYRIEPSPEGFELVLLKIEVANHTATSAIVNIDGQAAELHDFLRGRYYPIDINERAQEVKNPPTARDEQPADFRFLWNRTFENGESEAFDLKNGFGVTGWLVFEAPKDTKFRELRWRAGDSLSIDF